MAERQKWGTLGVSGKMHKLRRPAPDAGQSSQDHSGSRRTPGSGGNGKGSTASGNKSFAGTQTPGQTAADPSGGNDKFAKGGSTKMFGNRGSQRVEGGKTAQ